MKTKHTEEKFITVRDLLDYFQEYGLAYDIKTNAEALDIARDLRLEYPYEDSQYISGYRYYGACDGGEITCFITIADNLAIWAVYGTECEGFQAHDIQPSWAFSDKCVRVK